MKPVGSEGQSTALFELQLRLGSEIIPVQVLNCDDRSSLTQRVCRDNRIDSHYRQLIKSKIVDALSKIAHSGSTQQPLLRKVQMFMSREEDLKRKLQQVEEMPFSSSNESSIMDPMREELHHRDSSGERELFTRELLRRKSEKSESKERSSGSPSSLRKQSEENSLERYMPMKGQRMFGQLLNNSQPRMSQQNLKPAEKSKARLPPTPNKSHDERNRSTTGIVRTHEDLLDETEQHGSAVKAPQWKATGAPSQFDIDLLNAYRNVHAKCKNPQMKEMVRKIVQQLEKKQKYEKPPRASSKQRVRIRPFAETTQAISADQLVGNHKINMFSFQDFEMERQRMKQEKQAVTRLMNRPYLAEADTKPARVSDGPTSPFDISYERQQTPKVDLDNLEQLLNRNSKLLKKTSPKKSSAGESHSSAIPSSILNKNPPAALSRSPKKVQFAEQRNSVSLIAAEAPLSSRRSAQRASSRQRSPARAPHYLPAPHKHFSQSEHLLSAVSNSSFDRSNKIMEPAIAKNPAIRPSMVSCIQANPNNSRRFKYLEQSDYCM